jgi:DNA-binding FrmR family transcriptional regulator
MATHEHTQQVARRLARIEGHVAAVKRMVEQQRPCVEVLLQIAAVRAALNSAASLLLADHMEHCLAHPLAPSELERELEALKLAMQKFIS